MIRQRTEVVLKHSVPQDACNVPVLTAKWGGKTFAAKSGIFWSHVYVDESNPSCVEGQNVLFWSWSFPKID